MQPTDVTNVVTRATAVNWESGLLALLVLVLTGLVAFHYRAMWTHIQRAASDSQDVIDDNTLAWLQVARVFSTRPCLHDSDADKVLTKTSVNPEDFVEHAAHVRRVLERRKKREAG